MVRRDPRHPALRGYQVWRWMRKRILKVRPLFGTPILVVQEAVRVRLTRDYRTTLSQGIFLVPRWIRAPKYELAKFPKLSVKGLKARGLVWVKRRNDFFLLIYQQVDGIGHLHRQQNHVLFDKKRTEIFDLEIKPYVVVRKVAAGQLKKQRRKQLEIIRERRIRPPLKILSDPDRVTPKDIEGIIRHLDNVIAELEKIVERPLATRRKRAQRSLQATQRQLEKGNFYLARKRLRKALENLTWPEGA